MMFRSILATAGLVSGLQTFHRNMHTKYFQTKLFSKTMFDKIWDSHVVQSLGSDNCLIYIDRHLVHEVTSPQAFEGLKIAERTVRRPEYTLVTADHNIPTTNRKNFVDSGSFITDQASRAQVLALEENVHNFKLKYFGLDDSRQGIVHIVSPEQGFTLPGLTIVCGDSHTATHGAFGSLAFGIGTSEVEHVLATQTLVQSKAKNMRVTVNGILGSAVTAKDIILHIISTIGTAGGTGHVIEFAGNAITDLSMEARMTVCNMAIEGKPICYQIQHANHLHTTLSQLLCSSRNVAGAKAGLIAPDEVTFRYLQGRPLCPTGHHFESALMHWQSLQSDADATFDKEVVINASHISPSVTWGTSPQDVLPISSVVPDPDTVTDAQRAAAMRRSLTYMGLMPGTPLDGLKVDKVFIGSCTNARIEDLRAAAQVAKGRTVAPHVYAMVVPGSGLVKAQAELEGLDRIFIDAGFDWREPGCSMCLAMNPDKLLPGERCASTSNRNFEGRQGAGGRTHLLSPAMAAAAAVTGCLTDVRKLPLSDIATSLHPASERVGDAPMPMPTGSSADHGAAVEPHVRANVTPFVNGAPAVSDPSKVFRTHTGRAAVLDIQNIDTDMIIPKQFLKTIHRSGLGQALFHDMRYHTDGSEKPDFVLNVPENRDISVLVVGANVGCGSSREHAPWALRDFGIRCIVSTSFADIFYNNCFKNGLLPVVLPTHDVADLMAQVNRGDRALCVDLPRQVIVLQGGREMSFEVDAFRKDSLMNGLDEIGATLQHSDRITQFEEARAKQHAWISSGVSALRK